MRSRLVAEAHVLPHHSRKMLVAEDEILDVAPAPNGIGRLATEGIAAPNGQI